MNEQLRSYIVDQLARSVSQDAIKKQLIDVGWSEGDINEAFVDPPSSTAQATPSIVTQQVVQSVASQSQTKRAKTGLIVGLVVLGLVLVSAGSAFAYWYFFPSPERVMTKMKQQLSDVRSVAYVIDGNIHVSEAVVAGMLNQMENMTGTPPAAPSTGATKEQTLSLYVTGSGNMQDATYPTTEAEVTVTADPALMGLQLPKLAVKNLDKIIYIKAEGLSKIGPADLTSLNNTWIKIDPQAIMSQFGLGDLQKKIEKKLAEDKTTQSQNADTQKTGEAMRAQIKQSRAVVVAATLPDEAISGVVTRHYKLNFNKDEMVLLVINLRQIAQNKTLTDQEKQAIAAQIAEPLPSGEIWIGKKDYLPYKLMLSGDVQGDTPVQTGKYLVTILLSRFNENMVIEAPASSMNIEDAINKIMISLTSVPADNLPITPALPSTVNTPVGVDADHDGLTDAQEKIYGTDTLNPDTDGDTYKDGEEVRSGFNPNGPGKLPAAPKK